MVYDKSHTDDLFQEVLLNVWRGLKNFRNDSQINTWVYRIVNNCSINYNLKQKRNKDKIQNFDGFNPNDKVDRDQKEIIYDLISQLKSADKMLIGLHLEGYAYKEIAEVLGMTVSNVGVKINRIKSELNTIYNQNK